MHCFTLGILLDLLEPDLCRPCPAPAENLRFSGFDLLPDTAQQLMPDTLYVGLLSQARALWAAGGRFCAACLADCPPADRPDPPGLLAVDGALSFPQLFARVKDCFLQLMDWQSQMQQAVICGASMTEFLALSEPVLGNYIAVSNSAMMLVAHTPGISCDCPLVRALTEKGYHPEETVARFRKENLFERWNHESGVYTAPADHLAKYPTVGKVFSYDNTYFEHVVMTCNHRGITRGLLDLFDLLLRVLEIYVERDWKAKLAVSHAHDALLTELLDGQSADWERMEERARIVGLPLAGRFVLLAIRPDETENCSMGRLSWDFSSFFPTVRTLCYRQDFTALMDAAQFAPSEPAAYQKLEYFLEKNRCRCGVSAPFKTLAALPQAYREAVQVLTLRPPGGARYFEPVLSTPPGCPRIMDYSMDALSYLLLENPHSADFWYSSPVHDQLRTLAEYDARHMTENVKLLYCYLVQERRATQTGAVLNMHRNNVVYHMRRVEELLGLSLEDPSVRLKLLCGYLLLRLYGLQTDP